MARSRSPRTVVASLFDASSAPIYLLDEKRTIVYANESLATWLGTSKEALIGLRCDYHAAIDARAETEVAGLAPPPQETRDAGAAVTFTAQVAAARTDGNLEIRSATFTPLYDQSKPVGVLAVVGQMVDDAADAADSDAHQLLLQLQAESRGRHQFDRFIGCSPQILAAHERMQAAAESRVRVLVVGPPGSGCEHVARTIHEMRHVNDDSTLTPLACELLDAGIFGNALAAIANQNSDWIEAGGAVLLLDVDRLSEGAQLELAEFFATRQIDLEILATARTRLDELSQQGAFRQDLADRLSTLTVELPALNQRRSDIPLLVQFSIERFNSRGGKQLAGASPEAMDLLMAYTWPRNVDELFAFVEEACRRAGGAWILEADLPERIHLAADAARFPVERDEPINLDDFLAEVESELVSRALERSKGNRAQAARLLGMNRARFLRRLEQVEQRNQAATDDSSDVD